MILSIVIVNYNVKYFLKQCLASVYGSQRELADGSRLELDVWVVDNDSVDDSVEMVRHDFPQVHLIDNHDNVGFARANNQALRRLMEDCQQSPDQDANHYLLLLNPDTVVEHDTFVKCVDFMREHADCGALCVKMIDGEGVYLKESKRGFPSPEASFYKLTGLTRLFPHSRRMAAYYMGHLPDDEVNEIEIMPGAYILFRSEVYRQIGGLDESYFMYGEDIDFSWRIHLAGWKNYYFPLTHIIHYKGESTKKGSMNYVYTFYNAMSIFVRKYFTGGNARLFNALLQMAIWLRAGVSWVKRVAARLAVPVADFALAYGGWVLLKQLWATYWAENTAYYPTEYTLVAIPFYILLLMVSSWLAGGYDRPLRPLRVFKGMGAGLVMLLAFYSLLDEGQRYSRMLIIAGSLWTAASALLLRGVLGALRVKGYALRARKRGKVLIVGDETEATRVQQLYHTLTVSHPPLSILHTPHTSANHLRDLIRIEKVEAVVFCGADIDLRHIISLMADLKTTGVEYKIAPAEGDFIIGSDSILTHNDVFLTELDTVSSDAGRRNKRLLDFTSALLLLLLSPVMVWFQYHKGEYFKHCLSVLSGRCSWVGHTGRPGVFQPADIAQGVSPQAAERLMLRYMRHYSTATDLSILLHNWRKL